jgi:hypothetical protein
MSGFNRVGKIALLCWCVSALAVARPVAAQGSSDVVLEWNRILIAALNVPGANPATVFVTRPSAIMQIAVFDALNSIDFQYQPYAVRATVTPGASRDVAAAQAAHDVLAALLPSLKSTFDAALAATVAKTDAAAAAAGSAVGSTAASAILAARANDGWNRVAAPYVLPDLPGNWQSTPPANVPATFVQYQDVQGFILPSARSLLVEPPPALTSARYAADFNETKSIGSATSTTRTSEETATANTWASVGNTTNPIAAWNVAMQDLTRSQNLDGLSAARMFALVNMAMHDGLWVTFTGKFNYGLWRPVTAIREAARDGNAATEADPSWLPLLVTPPYPSYPGNMTCVGISAAQTLTRVLGRDNIPFSITWTAVSGPNVVRSYNGLRQAADEEARSRVLGGIHFTFDNDVSKGVCTVLGDYASANYLYKR